MNAVKAVLPRAMRQSPLLLTAAGLPPPSLPPSDCTGCFVVLPAVTSVFRSTVVERTLHGAGALVSFFAALLVSPVFKAVVVCLHMSTSIYVSASRHACECVCVLVCCQRASVQMHFFPWPPSHLQPLKPLQSLQTLGDPGCSQTSRCC